MEDVQLRMTAFEKDDSKGKRVIRLGCSEGSDPVEADDQCTAQHP